MKTKTIRQIIEEGAVSLFNGRKKTVTDMVAYMAGYLESAGGTYDAVVVLDAILDAAHDGIIEW